MASANAIAAAKLIKDLNTVEDFEVIRAAYQYGHALMTRQVAVTIPVGSRVSFVSSKTGQKMTGTLVKMNRKTAKVVVNDINGVPARTQNWTVSPVMLKTA